MRLSPYSPSSPGLHRDYHSPFFYGAVEQNSLIPDPNTDPDPVFQMNPDTDLDSIWIQGFDDQKLKKNSTSKNEIYQKNSTFVGHFSLLDQDPDCESGYQSRDPIESGSNPDPEHCFVFLFFIRSLK